MNPILKNAFVAAGLTAATQAAADITLYEHPGFRGQSVTEQRQIRNLERSEFNNSASSAVVRGEAWQVCDEPAFSGRCVVLPPGEYPSLGQMGLNDSVTSARMEARVEPPIAPGPAQVTLFGRENFQGRPFTVDRPIGDLERFDFSDRASSVIIQGGTWEVCDDVRFSGRCVTLQPGRYPSLAAIGLGDRISSLRLAGSVPPPAPMPGQITFYGRQNFEGRAITVDRPARPRAPGFRRACLVGCRERRAVGSLRRHPVRRSLRRATTRSIPFACGAGAEQPHFFGARSRQPRMTTKYHRTQSDAAVSD